MRWPWTRPASDAPAYVDTPAGILSGDGVHYQTTETLLRNYAGPVVDAVGLESLLRRSGAWLRSPQTLAAWVMLLLLVVLPWWAAAGVAFLTYALWSAAAPGAVATGLSRAMPVLENPAVQGLAYIGALSAFASAGDTAAVWAGMGAFVALRLGVVGALLRPVVGEMQRSLYPLPAADQTLRALLIREALRRGISLDGFGPIEEKVRAFWRREKP
ncbi:MAG: hypothetical protein AAGK21_02660 [Bacteroidota bacterium]